MLCLAVMLSVMVVGAGAAFSDQDKIENTEAVDACSALNIINGYEDGAFHPERNIKRAEVTKMICVALNGGEEPNTSTNAVPTFGDVRGTVYEWAEGYIESCVAQGIVDGVGGNRFAPAGNVTGAQLAKMLLVSLGYNATTEKFTGNAWETNVNVRASQKHLYDGLEKMDTSAAVTRDQAAQMVWNALNAYVVEYKDGVVQDKVVGTTRDKITLLYDKYEAYVNVGTLTAINGKDLTIEMSKADAADSDTGDTAFTKLTTDYSALIGQKVKVIFTKNSNVLKVFATSDNTTYTVNMKDIEKDGDKVKLDGKSYGFDDGAKIAVVTLNAEKESVERSSLSAADFDNTKTAVATDTAVVKFVDNDGDGKLNIAVITRYMTPEVTYVGADRITADKTYKMADENIAKDLAKDDYAMISYNMYDECLDIVKAATVTNTLDSSRDKDGYRQYEIDKTWYNVKTVDATGFDKVSLGDTVKAHVVAGVIVSIDTNDGTGSVPMNIAIVVGNGNSQPAPRGAVTVYGNQVRLRFFDGSEKIVTVDPKGVKGTDTELGQAYKISGPDTNTKLEKLKRQKYNGYEFISTLTDVYGNPAKGGKVEAGDNGKLATINGKKVDDNAVIVLFDGAGNSKTITGKQFKAIAADSDDLLGTKGNKTAALSAFTKKVNGLDRVMLASVAVKDIDVSGISYDNYGYVVDDGSAKSNGDVEFRMWNGTENLTVKVEKADETEYAKGTLVAYSSVNKDGYLTDAVSFGTVKALAQDTNKDEDAKAAKLAVDANLADSGKSISVSNKSLNVTADTHVILVDSDVDEADKIGQPYKYGDVLKTAAKDGDTYKLNVVYRGENGDANDGDDLDLVVVDVTGAFDFNKPESENVPPVGDKGATTTDGNFTYTTTDKTLLTAKNADITDKGEVRFSLAPVSGIDTSKLAFDWAVYVNGNKVAGAKVAQGSYDDTALVTSGADVKDGDKITISLTNIKVTGASTNATADDINNLLQQDEATVAVEKVPAGKINVPKDAKLTIGADDKTANIADGANIGGEGTTKVKGDVNVGNMTVSGDVDMSEAKATIDSGKAVTVAGGGSLKIDTNTGDSGKLPVGTVTVAPGGELKSNKTYDQKEEIVLVGTGASARLQTEENTEVELVVAENGTSEMTITGGVTVPKNNYWYTHFDYQAKAKAIGMTLNGTLTIDGTMKLSSANAGGEDQLPAGKLTLAEDAKVIVNGTLEIASKATMDASKGSVTGAGKMLVGAKTSKEDSVTGKITIGSSELERPEAGADKFEYTYKDGAWSKVKSPV